MLARTIAALGLLALEPAVGAQRSDPAAPGITEKAPERADKNEQAHQAFRSGQAAFNAGRYEEALRLFQESYALSARPELLLTLAQTTRKLGQFDEAIAYVERYLATQPPQPMLRPTYEFLGQLRAEGKVARASAAAADEAKRKAAATPATATATAAAASDRRRRSLVIGLAVGGALLLAAAGITLGVVLGTSPSNRYPETGLGTVRFVP